MFESSPLPAELPRLGIFWFAPTRSGWRFLSRSKRFDQIQTIAGFKTYEPGHADVWDAVRKRDPGLAQLSYDQVPRGRVNWREADSTFLLLADEIILARNLHMMLTEKWRLPRDRVHVLRDLHYSTSTHRHLSKLDHHCPARQAENLPLSWKKVERPEIPISKSNDENVIGWFRAVA